MKKVRIVAAYKDKTGAVVLPSREPCLISDDVAAILLKKKCIKILDEPTIVSRIESLSSPDSNSTQNDQSQHLDETIKTQPVVRRRGRPPKKIEG